MIPAFDTRQQNGTLRVIAVDRGSAGRRARVEVGDVLEALNGEPLSSLNIAQIQQALTARSITYRIRSANRTRTATLVLLDRLPPA